MVAVGSALWSDDIKVVSLWRNFHLSFDQFFFFLRNRRASKCMWGWAAVSECGGPCVWDNHEDRVRFEAYSAIVARVCNMGAAMTWMTFSLWTIEILCIVSLKEVWKFIIGVQMLWKQWWIIHYLSVSDYNNPLHQLLIPWTYRSSMYILNSWAFCIKGLSYYPQYPHSTLVTILSVVVSNSFYESLAVSLRVICIPHK